MKTQEPPWLKALRKRNQPLSLAIDEHGYIEFWKYSFDGPHDYNLMVWHPEGDLDFAFDEPTRREYYGVDTPAFRRLSYKTKRVRLITKVGQAVEEHLPQDGVPWKDTERGMNDWLDRAPEQGWSEPPSSEWNNQYLAGHPIYDALTPKERRAWGITQGGYGGPGSGSWMATTVTCTLDDLNAIIRKKKLPFIVVEDKRFAKPSHSVLAKK